MALRRRTVDDLHSQTEIAQSALASMAELVVAERGVERAGAGEPAELDRSHGAPTAGNLP